MALPAVGAGNQAGDPSGQFRRGQSGAGSGLGRVATRLGVCRNPGFPVVAGGPSCGPPRGVAQARTFMLPNWADVGLKFTPEAGTRLLNCTQVDAGGRNVHL